MVIKKIGAVVVSAMIAAALVPAAAFADSNTPSVNYGDSSNSANKAEEGWDSTNNVSTTGGNVTDLTLVLQDPDANFASNGGSTWVAEHAKVQVPVAINFVVKSDGTIIGPSEGASITNYSSYPVNVSSIKATAANSVTFVSTAEAANSADKVYLAFKPSATGASISLGDCTGADGAVTEAGDWNIGTASGSNVLTIQDFTGKVGGFGAINPLSAYPFGTISWTIKAGSRFATGIKGKSVSDLTAAGAAIRGGNAAEILTEYQGYIGQTVNVSLANGESATARLVDVNTTKGLVFMFTEPITTAAMDESFHCWSESDLRTSMNSGDIYNTYFDGMTIRGSEVTPVQVANSSVGAPNHSDGDNGWGFANVISNDSYWVPSELEFYGTQALSWASESGSRFTYLTSNSANVTDCWLRTMNDGGGGSRGWQYAVYSIVGSNGAKGSVQTRYTNTTPFTITQKGVLACFAL